MLRTRRETAPRRADLGGETGTGGAQDFVDPPQLGALRREPLVLGKHVGGRAIMSIADVGLGLADPVAQGFRVQVQLLAQLAERRTRLGFPIQQNHAFPQLVGYFRGAGNKAFLPGSQDRTSLQRLRRTGTSRV
jgi:hypothetical protein